MTLKSLVPSVRVLCAVIATVGIVSACASIAPSSTSPSAATSTFTTKTLQVGDKSLAYFERGSGPPVVIIHGVGGHKEDWRGVADALAKTHRVFAIDMLGFGESSKTGDDLSMPVQAAAVKALLDAHGVDKADIVGNSVGGWVATTFAATYPASVKRLVIIDGAGFKAMFEGTPPVNFDPNTVEEMQALINITINSDVAKTPGLAEKALTAYKASGEKAISPTWGRSLYGSPRMEELFPKVKAPTLVLWGADDKLFPSVLCDAFAAQIAGATCQKIPNAGHFPQIDNGAATTAALATYLQPAT